MSARDREIAAEQEHVDRVHRRLVEVRADAAAVAADGHQRAQLGHEGGLYERDVLVHQASRRMASLDREWDGLVFGRLDLTTGEVRHVGRLGVRDAEFEPLLIDWRAPAAAPFYQATAERPLDVVRRRVIQSSGTTVTGLSDDLLDPDSAPESLPVIGDGALMAALTRARGHAMRDIVATIQRQQDEAVRAPAAGATLIDGGPGTGKTAVALHRVAFLLYQQRRRFEGGGVLMVGPSAAFTRYIERVLPSLGEDSVTLRSLGTVLDGVVATRRDDPATAAVKGSGRMRRVLARAVRDTPPGAPTELRVVYGGEVVKLDAAALAAARSAAHERAGTPNGGRSQGLTALVDALWRAAVGWAPAHWDRKRFTAEVRDRNEVLAFLDAWWPALHPEDVLGWFADPARVNRYAGGIVSSDEMALLSRSFRRQDGWTVADVALLDELGAMLGTAPKPVAPTDEDAWDMPEIVLQSEQRHTERAVSRDSEYALVVVDEAQDLSPMQWRMLGRRGRHASWTVVGDRAQRSWQRESDATNAMNAALGRGPRHTFTLTTNYRNSAEIFELAAEVLGEAADGVTLPKAVRRTGHPPEQLVTDDLAGTTRDAVTKALDAVEGTVGVVTSGPMRDEVAGWLTEHPRVEVVDEMDVKGLEYDAAVVVEPAAIVNGSPSGRRLLYVALSRATHRLCTVSTDPSWLPSPGLW